MKNNSIFRMGMRTLMTAAKDFDIPLPPRPAPPLWVPPFCRDTIHNPRGASWEALIPDLSVLDGVFPLSEQAQLRFVSKIEYLICRKWCSAARQKYPLPCDTPGRLAFFNYELRRFAQAESISACDHVYVTTASYPEWLSNPESRARTFEDTQLLSFGL